MLLNWILIGFSIRRAMIIADHGGFIDEFLIKNHTIGEHLKLFHVSALHETNICLSICGVIFERISQLKFDS